MQRRDSEYISGRTLRLELAGRQAGGLPGGEPKRRFMHVAKENMKTVGEREEDERTGRDGSM